MQAPPTVRALATRLDVSPATVASAYKLLKARGIVAGDGRRGMRRVAALPPPFVGGGRMPDRLVDLATGNPDVVLLPPLEPALRMINTSHVMYGDHGVDPALARFAAAEFEADDVAAQAIAVTGGALDAIERILREYLRAGDRIGVEDPGDAAVVELALASALVPTAIAVDEAGPRPDAFEEALRNGSRAVIVPPRAHNPTGAAITEERGTQLSRILRRFPDVAVIEHDGAAVVAGAPVVRVHGAPHAPWAFVRSTSKFLGPDLRIAVVAGDEITIARVASRQALGVRWVSHVVQRLAMALWSDPANGRRFARAAELYGARRQALRAALAARGIQSSGGSGLNVWLPVLEESAIVHGLAERGWAVAAGERFRLQSRPAVRITISTLDPADAVRLAEDLAAVIRPSRAAMA